MNALTVVQNNQIVEQQSVTSDLFNRFISYLDASQKTIETYTKALKQFFMYLSLHGITQPHREDVKAYKEDLIQSGHKPTTIQGYMVAVKLFFRWTAQEGLYPNVADHIKGAKLDSGHKKDYLTVSQVKDILAGIDTTTLKGLRDYAIVSLMVSCGLRDIEVVRANTEDIRTIAGVPVLFVQGKGRTERTEYVKLSVPVERAIRAYLMARGGAAEQEPLFTSLSNRDNGSRLTTRSISGLVKGHFIEAGFDSARITAHSLRHTAVTLSLLAGKPLEEVMKFARHKNIATTMIYNHALDMANNSCSEAVCNAIFG